jgi:hypothetical protein
METRTCRTCGETKPLEEGFYFADKAKGIRLRQCRICHARQSTQRRLQRLGREGVAAAQREYNARRSPEQRFAHQLRYRYGITAAEWHDLLEAQGHACAICRTPLSDLTDEDRRGLHVDHCHVTGRVRGLLCNACNRSIGGLRDDPGLLRKAADYIESGGVPMATQHPEWVAKAFLNSSKIRRAQ